MLAETVAPIESQFLQQFSDFFTEVSRIEHWQSLLNTLTYALFGNLLSSGMVLMILLIGFMSYQRLIWFSDRIIKRANREEFISSQAALQLFSASAAASLLCWTPLLFLGSGLYLFSSRAGSPDFHASLGVGLVAVFFVGLGYHLLQEFFSHGGLSKALYGFKYANSRYIINRLEVTIHLATPLIFLIAFTREFQNGHWFDSVGRVGFVLGALLTFSQFHQLLWPTSRLYQRLANDEATAHSAWLRHRILIYIFGSTVFFLLIGLTLGGWLEHANAFSIKVSLTLFSAMFLFAAKTILSKRATETLRKFHLIDDLGRSTESAATARSPRVQQFISRYSHTAHRGIDFLMIVLFVSINYWVWRKWIALPPELLNIQIGGLALSGIIISAKLLVIGLSTYYFARELPASLMWCFTHQTRQTIGNPGLVAKLIGFVIVYAGLWLSMKVVDLELPVIPWLGTLLTISLLFGARNLIEDGMAGLRLIFDSRVTPGDCIEVDGRFGRVAAVNWFSTLVEDNMGTVVVVPNSKMVSQTLVKSRDEDVLPLVIDVTLPRQADAYQAQAVMMMVAQGDPAIVSEPPPHVRFLGFRMTDIQFQIRMLVAATQDVAETRSRIEQKLEVEFERHEIFGQDEFPSLRFERFNPDFHSERIERVG